MPGGAGNLGQTLGTWPFSAGKHDGSAGAETVPVWKERIFRKWNRKRPESGTEAKTGNPAAGYEAKQQGIYISVAPNPRAELEETVRLIRRMVREEGMRYQDFAVLTGDLSVYGTYAREIFENVVFRTSWMKNIPC